MDDRKIVDPRFILEDDLILIVFSHETRSLFNFLTAWRTKGYGHVMIMHKSGYFASQGFTGYKEIPVKKYMRPGVTLEFWKLIGLTEAQKADFDAHVKEDLKDKPWWKSRYDFLGIIGQASGFRNLQSPWANYCSEKVRSYLVRIFDNVPKNPAPAHLREFLKNQPGKAKLLGYYIGD